MAPSTGPARHVAYLVNHYPKVSHSFIRREILALERQGVEVHRYSVRGHGDSLVDPDDLLERQRTSYLLAGGLLPLLASAAVVALRHPLRFARAWRLAWAACRRSDRTVLHHLAYLFEACRLERLLVRRPVDHLHAHFGTNSAEVALLLRVLGGPPYSFTVHGPEEFDRPTLLNLRTKVAHARFVVAISSFGRSQLMRWIEPADWAKVEVVHCGLEPDFHRLDQASNPPDVARVVCVGRLCEQKGQLLALEAVARLARRGVPCELVLAGDGEMRPEVERRIAELALEERVHITGWLSSSQVREQILACRALLMPSLAEGLPVAIMEALALRRPVISTYVAGIPELVRPGQEGWLVPPSDVAALTEALEACLSAPPEELDRLATSGYERVLARHDVDQEAARLRELFIVSGAATSN